MPQQLPVSELVVLGELLCFAVPLNLPHIEKLEMAGGCLQAQADIFNLQCTFRSLTNVTLPCAAIK